MNRSKIEWCDYTWNPITGCLHNCPYCYAKRITVRFAGNVKLNKMAKGDYRTIKAESGESLYILDKSMINETGCPLIYPFEFEPTLHKYRLKQLENFKTGKNIFVGAMADIFGEWIPGQWLDEVFETCEEYSEHNYIFLTKNPARYMKYGVPVSENIWYGATITCKADVSRIADIEALGNRFISIEPLLEDIEPENHTLFNRIDWIIIGAETGRRTGRVIPNAEWINKITDFADKAGIPVFMKESLVNIVGENNMLRDYPEGLKNVRVSPKMKDKLFDVCAECRKNFKKSDMITLSARSKRGESSKRVGFLCKECFERFCKNYKLKAPLLEKTGKEDCNG